MAKVPVTVPRQPFGSANPRAPTSGGRVARPPSIALKGPAQGLEQFNDPALSDATNRALNQLQANLREALQQIKSNPLANGRMFTGVQFTVGQFTVLDHGFGSPAKALLCNPQLGTAGSALIVVDPFGSDLDKVQIRLDSAGTFVADVWVYVGG